MCKISPLNFNVQKQICVIDYLFTFLEMRVLKIIFVIFNLAKILINHVNEYIIESNESLY